MQDAPGDVAYCKLCMRTQMGQVCTLDRRHITHLRTSNSARAEFVVPAASLSKQTYRLGCLQFIAN